MKEDIIIGIDPDVGMSGVARLDVEPRKVWADHLPFPLLIDYVLTIKEVARMKKKNLVVYVEAGWLNTSHWHISARDTRSSAAAKGNAVGRNHETGRKLIEMLQHYGIDVREQRPLKKVWRGNDGKITHSEISSICGWDKRRSNQEERDAMLIAWNASGLPIKLRK